MCCSMLQRIVECGVSKLMTTKPCEELSQVTLCWSVSQEYVLPCVAVCCRVLQCVAVCCSVSQECVF